MLFLYSQKHLVFFDFGEDFDFAEDTATSYFIGCLLKNGESLFHFVDGVLAEREMCDLPLHELELFAFFDHVLEPVHLTHGLFQVLGLGTFAFEELIAVVDGFPYFEPDTELPLAFAVDGLVIEQAALHALLSTLVLEVLLGLFDTFGDFLGTLDLDVAVFEKLLNSDSAQFLDLHALLHLAVVELGLRES